MTHFPPSQIVSGATPQQAALKAVQGAYVSLFGETYYKIKNYDAMEPFFISIVSSSDHWLFIASTGGLSAGRGTAEQAIFPYYTVDKLTENSENTGAKTIMLVRRSDRVSLWEPFSDRQWGVYSIERSLYKNLTGTALVFEEANHDLGLTFRYAWRTGERFGFIKTGWLENTAAQPCSVDLLDGLQNILPANVSSQTQNVFGALLDAYKRTFLHPETGLGVFALNSRLTDLAEPSESLLATTAAQVGLDASAYLLSSQQFDRFRRGEALETETEVRGRRGAYFVRAALELRPGEERSWHLFADTPLDAAAIAEKLHWLRGDPQAKAGDLEADIASNRRRLWNIVASADGVQLSNDPGFSAHHFANVMFNVMRGGFFVGQYEIQSKDFAAFVAARNRPVFQAQQAFFDALLPQVTLSDLLARAGASGSPDLLRLSYAYLPLTFSRRHGDPSRPWNRFAINVRQPDGTLKIDYEGNWRDIFQNWEALAYAYPEYVESMISTFLNATTVDGYNPYRITHHGIDWEIPEPNNPWANIGYWSDHQIIYLLKLMEISAAVHPGRLETFLDRRLFSYADVPYRVKPFGELLKDPYNTIAFDWDVQRRIEARERERGADGKLVTGADGEIQRASLAEKLLTLLLAKLVNFVPGGGIWMNTQRPEWNDANNALVGKGISVVTLCYLRRYIAFARALFAASRQSAVPLRAEVQAFFAEINAILNRFLPALQTGFDDAQRRAVMAALGETGSRFRWNFYEGGLSEALADAPVVEIIGFLDLAQRYVEHTLRANRRADGLFHSYNILHLNDERATVGHLYEMLEGQVAVLSSGLLTAEESLALLTSLSGSALYQPEQHTYILYPDRDLPGFFEKNRLTQEQIAGIPLLQELADAQDRTLLIRDVDGFYHFSGPIRNFKDVEQVLKNLRGQPEYAPLVETDRERIRALFEETFHHDQFTGRSGTFFAYEGLGSVYWHMVAKLLLAAQETALRFKDTGCAAALMERYTDIKQGLGFNKTPQEFGAFPTDPYSHTPKGQGAKQPGMTGAVKEEILARQTELGYTVAEGRLVFDLTMLDRRELLEASALYTYLDVRGEQRQLNLPAASLAYTICQTPVILKAKAEPRITVHFISGGELTIPGNALDEAATRHIFLRDGVVQYVEVGFAA